MPITIIEPGVIIFIFNYIIIIYLKIENFVNECFLINNLLHGRFIHNLRSLMGQEKRVFSRILNEYIYFLIIIY